MTGFAIDRARYLDPAADLDGVMAAVLELASQVWVLADRQAIIEHLLAERGSVTREEIDAFVPSGELAQRLAESREQLTRRLLDAFLQAKPKKS